MNEHILIVEDEQELCMTLGDRLRSEGYAVECAFDGKAGFEMINQTPFDLVILDLMLPMKSGLDLCVDIRRSGFTTPILILTALGQSVEKVAGLKLGADDYVTKPFDTLELMARVEALLRRAPNRVDSTRTDGQGIYRLGAIVVDSRRGKVTSAGRPVNLTSREFQLLRYLVEHNGVTVSREELLEQVWGHIPGTLTRTVDMHIASLRQKMEVNPKRPEMIITVPLMGYKFQI
jgi:two-component system, OmpR family, alkaline phosphatase synthesis response regulator PhoP